MGLGRQKVFLGWCWLVLVRGTLLAVVAKVGSSKRRVGDEGETDNDTLSHIDLVLVVLLILLS